MPKLVGEKTPYDPGKLYKLSHDEQKSHLSSQEHLDLNRAHLPAACFDLPEKNSHELGRFELDRIRNTSFSSKIPPALKSTKEERDEDDKRLIDEITVENKRGK
jgi:hypothetical protein